MKIFKLVLITASTLKIIDYSKEAGMIIYIINASNEGWGGNLMQVEQNGKWQHMI